MARGADDPDLSNVVRAAERAARVEDHAIFNGYPEASIAGIVPSTPHAPIPVDGPSSWPEAIVHAKEVLRQAGIAGPHALALGPAAYDEISAASDDGYPLRKRIESQILDGPFVWAPAVKGAVLLSVRGGDFELTVGQDLSIGFAYLRAQADRALPHRVVHLPRAGAGRRRSSRPALTRGARQGRPPAGLPATIVVKNRRRWW